jgi:hypothetical protein
MSSKDTLPLQDQQDTSAEKEKGQDIDQGLVQVQEDESPAPIQGTEPLFPASISPVRAERQHAVLQDAMHGISQRAGRQTNVSSQDLSQWAERQQHALQYGPTRAGRHVVQQYQIHSMKSEAEDPALEDDEMLELQINLGEVQERNLMRKIEHKRRRANQTVSSDGGFNLTRELEAEIDKELARRLEEEKQKNKVLENELAMVQINLTRDMKAEHEMTMNQARTGMQQQIEALTAIVERRYEEMLNSKLEKQRQA